MLTSWSRTFSTVSRTFRIAALRVRNSSRSRGSRSLLEGTRFCFAAELRRHVRRIAPEAFESVEPPYILGEDVHDEIAEIDEHPAAGRRALDEQRFHTQLVLQSRHDAVGDGLR